MGCGGNQPQQQSRQVGQSNLPAPDDQTKKMMANYQAMRGSGMFNTPYQNMAAKHPYMMGIANGLQAFGQGLTHQPFYTGNQENQANLQNTQLQGLNNINALPAQMRMMMMMNQIRPGQAGQSIPGVPNAPTGAPPGAPAGVAPTSTQAPGGAVGSMPFQVGQMYNGHKILSVQQVK